MDPLGLVPIAKGIAALSPSVETRDVNGFEVEMEIVAIPATRNSSGRFICNSIKVTRGEGGPPVTGEALRALPVAKLLREASSKLWLVIDDAPGAGISASRRRITPTMAARFRTEGPTDEVLEWVARAYRLALIMGDPPTRAVESAFRTEDGDMPRSSAGRWIALARQKGFLGASEGPGRAGG